MLLLAALAVAPVGFPVQISYVHSESMEPAIHEGDGYFLGPVGEIDDGDIVTFRSEARNGYVTHRIVGRSEQGYITQGDNNPTADQAAGYAYVSRDAVVGEVITFQGHPITVPNFGTTVTVLRANTPLLFGGLGLLLLRRLFGRRSRSGRPRRQITRMGDLARPLFAAGLIALTALVLLGATTQTLSFVAVDGGSGAPHVVSVGETATDTLRVASPSTPFTTRVVDVSGARAVERARNASTVTAEIVIPPQSGPGSHAVRVTAHKYPSILPSGAIRWVHAIHPVLAALVTSTLTLAPLGLLFFLYVDGAAPLRESRTRWLRRWRGRSD